MSNPFTTAASVAFFAGHHHTPVLNHGPAMLAHPADGLTAVERELAGEQQAITWCR
ncbi:MAG: hypothetical protein H6545_01640 [Bacteroidales bacterium]|nr:hypothetical protein [Bacteroidales bacterium]